MKNNIMRVLLFIFTLLFGVSCRGLVETDICITDTTQAKVSEKFDSILSDRNVPYLLDDNTPSTSFGGYGDITPDIADSFMHLRNGDTMPLVGFSFGDEFDYDLFDVCGYSNGSYHYNLKALGYGGLCYIFDGRGNRFSGLAAYTGAEFFGIKTFEDSFEKLVNILGEPDEYIISESVRIDTFKTFAEYHFEKAIMKIAIKVGGVIGYIEYNALESIFDDMVLTTVQTDFSKDVATGSGYLETIYRWDYCFDSSKLTSTSYSPYNEEYNENNKTLLIENYLREYDMYKDTPDGVAYDELGLPLVEYYTDNENNKFCFVVHLWDELITDFDTGTSVNTDAIFCVTLSFDDSNKMGYIIYNNDSEQGISREQLYDAWGKKMSDVSYKYLRGVPFPFITKYWNINSNYELIWDALCRDQKNWLYKEQASFDETGRFIGCGEIINTYDRKTYLTFPSICVYNEDGSLTAIQGELQKYDRENDWGWWDDSIDYSGQIKFSYSDNGNVSSVDYFRSSYSHGTNDSGGTVSYDKEGRMIQNDYYITHGRHTNIFLYEGDADKPWACFYWCSFIPGFEKIYLYRPE